MGTIFFLIIFVGSLLTITYFMYELYVSTKAGSVKNSLLYRMDLIHARGCDWGEVIGVLLISAIPIVGFIAVLLILDIAFFEFLSTVDFGQPSDKN